MDLAVTILGSGTCVPSLKRSSCSVFMETGGEKLLFDCGPGTMRRLLEAGARIFDISYIFFSHIHPDHTGELACFLFAIKYPEIKTRQKPLTIVAGRGFADFYNRMKKVYGNWIEFDASLLKIVELDGNAHDFRAFEGFDVESLPVEHIEGSIAYRITSPAGKSVVYSGDTDFSENLVILAENADILVCESAFPDELKAAGHLTPSLAGKIAAKANVKKLVLTHFYPECDKADIEGQCRKTYSGKLILAEDLMKIPLDD